MIKKCKGSVAPFFIGMVMSVGFVSTITAKQFEQEYNKIKEKEVNLRKEHIQRTNRNIANSFHAQSNHSNSGINTTKLKEGIFTNIFDTDKNQKTLNSKGSKGSKNAIISNSKNEYRQRRITQITSSNTRSQDIDITSSTIIDEENIRQEQIMTSYKNMKKLAGELYLDISKSAEKKIPCNLNAFNNHTDAWNQNFTLTRKDDTQAQLSFTLPWKTGTKKVLDIKLPDIAPKENDDSEPIIKKLIINNSRSGILTTKGDLWFAGYTGGANRLFGHYSDYSKEYDKWYKVNVLPPIDKFYMISSGVYAIAKSGQLYYAGLTVKGGAPQVDRWRASAELTDVKDIKISSFTTVFALNNDGTVYSAGSSNNKGQLGLGDTNGRDAFTKTNLSNIDKLYSLGSTISMTLAISHDNKLYAAGYNTKGQLGAFAGTDLLSFTYIPQGDGIVEVLNNPNGGNQDRAQYSLRNDGKILMSGDDFYRQMGQGWQGGAVEELTPMSLILEPGDSIKSVITDHLTRFGYITQNGKFYVSGSNNNNQLGVNNGEHVVEYTTEITNIPAGVEKANFLSLEASFVIDKNKEVWVAGKNTNNQLGNPDKTLKYLTWTKIPGITGAKEIYKYFGVLTVILTDSGEIWVTGKNANGQLGLGHTNNVETWTKVPGITGVQDIIIHEDKSIYLMMDDQTILVAGRNSDKQFGTSTPGKQTTFMPLVNNEFLDKLKGEDSGDSCS